jgi:hypothetical protein
MTTAMRAYFTTSVERARTIFDSGFTDLYEEFGVQGVNLSTRPLDVNDGFDGDVTLCLDVPEGTFKQYDVTDTGQEQCGYRLALIPAPVLNGIGKPQVYDHAYAGASRRELPESIKTWEQDSAASSQLHAQEMRDAVKFFDSIGWLTPLKLREGGAADQSG